MEYNVTKELDMQALQEEILRKCRKKTESLILPDEMENNKKHKEEDLYEEDITSIETERTTNEELPFEDILAEKRRKYTTKQEFIYSLYNNILPAFVAEWDGYFLRKKRFAKRFSQDDVETIEKNKEIDDYNKNDDSFIEKQEEKDKIKITVPSWKISLPDEFANIKFYNNNSYCGRISKKMMEGEGTYTWHNGVQYKGQFEQNKIQGKGLLKWSNNCWYEGDFVDGLRHGKGILVDRANNRIYVGQWCMGHMCGKGYNVEA
ncbi:Radial spoke head 10 like protein B [Trachymyrmex zeteki]|uniref:Radial spoke head 10 like protein B n=1 Tax=Mycetomoellerius zeteki TaxID=64791 RepID=A0A151XG46_9HYME|nr:PREDICTED: radial spoke head 10 homolog B2-like [Trachymyrmex zeteki]KYQ59346.1 Radial spoke head 10 like protein B [Trachymyrmex zeteki]